ncbi:MAG: hypothetical protein ACK2UO_11120 [Caldilineaceae bacterium]|jgi:hypothetical protein
MNDQRVKVKSKNTGRWAVLIATMIVAISLPVAANDRDVRAKTVPASVCEPANSGTENRVLLSNGAWVFRSGQTGTVTFWCPVSLNAYTVSNTGNDNDISWYRVYYRDTDGTGTAARVTTRLTYRRSNGLFSAGSTWNSNSSSGTGNKIAYKQNTHDVRFGALYAFLVTLQRTSTSQSPAFSGIDFELPPVP